ncbi:centrosomal protein kizuna [Rhinophrynus dorsalis]
MAESADNIGSSDFDHRIGNLQRNLRDCEGKRLALERKLFQYSSSDAHICQLKYAKLKQSLKEVCEREKRARLRNQAFLQEFDRVEARLLGLIANTNSRQQMKALQASRQTEINTGTNMSRRMYHPATIFMGRQMSANSSIEHCLTQRKSPQPTKSFSISDPHSVRQAAINSNLTDSCVVPANSDILCLNKPDKIDGETSFQISEKMPVTSTVPSQNGRTHCVEIDKTQSGRKHLFESKQSAQLSTQTLERLSPRNRARDLQNDSPGNKVENSLMYERLVPNEERFIHASPSGSSPDACDYTNKQTSDKHSASENLSGIVEGCNLIPKEEDHDILDSSSDLTVSISESEDSVDDSMDVIDKKEGKSQDSMLPKPGREFDVTKVNEEATNIHFQRTTENNSSEDSSSISTVTQNALTDKGFFHLLKSIESMVPLIESDYIQLYHKTNLSQTKLDCLIRLCNQTETLRVEDLEACSALVLHHLQSLLKKPLSKCSLTEETITDSKFNMDSRREGPIPRSVQKRLLDHISFLKEHQILNKGAVPPSFSTILMLNNEMEPHQDVLALAEEEGNVHSTTQSWSSINSKQSDDEPNKEISRVHSNVCEQDVTVLCEDDKKEDNKERKHVGGNSEDLLQCTKSTAKDLKDLKEGNDEDIGDISEYEIPGLTVGNVKKKPSNKLSSETSVSSSERSPSPRKEDHDRLPTNIQSIKVPTTEQSSTVMTNIKSKAFWGESEDSSSEIEALLRPQSHNVDGDDFDDFFD